MAVCLTLKKSNCKNCYKCIRHCPVKSIRFSGNQAHVIQEECILCGRCFVVCPQNAKQIADGTEKVRVLLQSGEKVFVSLAPSFVANYEGVGLEGMRAALKQLGFEDVEETALGATVVKREYERLLREQDRDVLITSCCHSINLLVQKYFPHLLGHLADVLSPMQAHCADIKRRYPGAKTVFVGPCIAKKDEAQMYGDIVDAVLTFEELSAMMESAGIKPEGADEPNEQSRARLFPTTGGILKTLSEQREGYTYLAIDGMENCIRALQDIESGRVHKTFIEMSACVGSCIGGPVMEKARRSPVFDYKLVSDASGRADFPVESPSDKLLRKQFAPLHQTRVHPSEADIIAILHQMGKTEPSDELNCGSCGYDTCRAKAEAIYYGKADVSMCLPYLKDRAESFSESIVKTTPNGLLVLNADLEVQQINEAACKILKIRTADYVLGEPVVRILDPTPFMKVLKTGRAIRGEQAYLAEYSCYVDQTIVLDRENKLLICILRDISAQMKEREKKEAFSRQTIEIADRVVERQMRIVQEIASLLGETAAETKIALTKLKESISDE